MDKSNKQKTLLIRLSPEMHKEMRHISIEYEKSLNEIVVQAFEKIIKDYKEKNNGDK